MPWLKLDDAFFDHPKILDLSKDAKLLYLASLTYAGQHLTDGHLSSAAMRLCAAKVDVHTDVASELTAAQLWHADDAGYHIHDFLDFNPSAEDVRRKREQGARRIAAWRARHKKNYAPSSNGVTNDNPIPSHPLRMGVGWIGGMGDTGKGVEPSIPKNDADDVAAPSERLTKAQAMPEITPFGVVDVPRDAVGKAYDLLEEATGGTTALRPKIQHAFLEVARTHGKRRDFAHELILWAAKCGVKRSDPGQAIVSIDQWFSRLGPEEELPPEPKSLMRSPEQVALDDARYEQRQREDAELRAQKEREQFPERHMDLKSLLTHIGVDVATIGR